MNNDSNMKQISKDALNSLCEMLSYIISKEKFTSDNLKEIISVSRWIDEEDIPEDEEDDRE